MAFSGRNGMRSIFKTAVLVVSVSAGQSAFAASEAEMMSTCNSYAAHHLHVSTSDIAALKYEGQRVDGTHAVNGSTTFGETFQCSFNRSGSHVVNWYHSGGSRGNAQASEAEMMSACNSYAAHHLHVSASCDSYQCPTRGKEWTARMQSTETRHRARRSSARSIRQVRAW